MLVVAALRWVDSHPAVDALTGDVRTDPRAAGAGEADRGALEHALRAAERFGGRCLAVTVGPRGADGMLREALAAGADEVLRVDSAGVDPVAGEDDTARLLADGLLAGHPPPDLVVCGAHSADRGTGATPAFLAERLGAAQALGLLELTVAGRGLRALRRLDGGRRERLAVPLPAVCSLEAGTVRLRRAPLPAVLAARDAAIPFVHAAPGRPRARVTAARSYRPRPQALPGPRDSDPRGRISALTGAHLARTPPRVVMPGTAEAAARQLLDDLREHGYLDECEITARSAR